MDLSNASLSNSVLPVNGIIQTGIKPAGMKLHAEDLTIRDHSNPVMPKVDRVIAKTPIQGENEIDPNPTENGKKPGRVTNLILPGSGINPDQALDQTLPGSGITQDQAAGHAP